MQQVLSHWRLAIQRQRHQPILDVPLASLALSYGVPEKQQRQQPAVGESFECFGYGPWNPDSQDFLVINLRRAFRAWRLQLYL